MLTLGNLLLLILAISVFWIGWQLVNFRDELNQILNDLATMLGEELERHK